MSCAGAGEFIEAQPISRREATLPRLSWPDVSPRTTRLALLIVAAVVAAFVAAVAIRAFSGPGTATKAEYQATVQNARDRVDYALEQITKPTETDQLPDRFDQAAAVLAATSKDLDNAGVAKGFGDLNARLSDKLDEFSNELTNTAAQFRDPSFASGALGGINSIGFTQWDDVNAILTEMNKRGLKVELLQRHLSQ
jgi:hypothetical protein